MNRQSATLYCPRALVGRIIGKNGETIKALQNYTGAMIQIDQTCEPTQVGVSGNTQSMALALSMIADIIKGNFRGFALLRQCVGGPSVDSPAALGQPLPVYVPGYGLVPPTQGVIVNAAGHPNIMAGPGMMPYAEYMDPMYAQQQMPPPHVVVDMGGGQVQSMGTGPGMGYAVRPPAGGGMQPQAGQMMLAADPSQGLSMSTGHARLFAAAGGRRPQGVQPSFAWAGEVQRPANGAGVFGDMLHSSRAMSSRDGADGVYAQFDVSEQQVVRAVTSMPSE